jgi:fluoride exporter
MKMPVWFGMTVMVAIGGAFGSVSRYWLSEGIHYFFDRGFPIAILVVNVLGSLLMGFLAVYIIDKMDPDYFLRTLVLIGFLGAFTTFSTFSLDTVALFNRGAYGLALLNIGLSVVLCLFAAAAGIWFANKLGY